MKPEEVRKMAKQLLDNSHTDIENDFDEFLFAAAAESISKTYLVNIKFIRYRHIVLYDGMALDFKTDDDVNISVYITPSVNKSEDAMCIRELNLSKAVGSGTLRERHISSKTLEVVMNGRYFDIEVKQGINGGNICSIYIYSEVQDFIQCIFDAIFKDDVSIEKLTKKAKELRLDYAQRVQARRVPNAVADNNNMSEYDRFKMQLRAKSKIDYDGVLNTKVDVAIDGVFGYCALRIEDNELINLKYDVFGVMRHHCIANEKLLSSIIFTILLDYYNMGMINVDSCKGNVFVVCKNTADNIAREIFA